MKVSANRSVFHFHCQTSASANESGREPVSFPFSLSNFNIWQWKWQRTGLFSTFTVKLQHLTMKVAANRSVCHCHRQTSASDSESARNRHPFAYTDGDLPSPLLSNQTETDRRPQPRRSGVGGLHEGFAFTTQMWPLWPRRGKAKIFNTYIYFCLNMVPWFEHKCNWNENCIYKTIENW